MTDAAPQVVIGLSAVVLAIRGGEIVVLTVRPEDVRTHRASDLRGLPFGPFDPAGHRTFELALRAFVNDQTGFRLGYVEQLYTFGDLGRDAPLADLGAVDAAPDARMISVGYLALTPQAAAEAEADAAWRPWTRYFPWEDWRRGRPPVIEQHIAPALKAWAGLDSSRMARARGLFALDGAGPWNEERMLERYELLYEAGLAAEAARDRGRAEGVDLPEPSRFEDVFGRPLMSDHRRILATAVGRLRGKLKYRPVIFELMPEAFTLLDLQQAVEAISGVRLHKQNFRRMIERTGLVQGLGRQRTETGGRPAELFRYQREEAATRGALGLSLPVAS
ncbi:MAG: NAD regulator [Pseudomonadota bacterium]|nr:NAD regulator [Pseudomonadota bacterium]